MPGTRIRLAQQPLLLPGCGTATDYARTLLESLGLKVLGSAGPSDPDPGLSWASSGLMSLTGLAGGRPQMCPAPLASCADGLIKALNCIAPATADSLPVGRNLLGERAAIAGLLAARDGHFDLVLWLLVTVGLLFAHATNNLVNDFTDFVKGVDKDNYFRAQYGPQPLEHGLMSKGQLLAYIAVTGGIALATGIGLVAFRGQPTLFLLGAGAFFVLFYTWPLKYVGLGEVAVILVWGPLMVGGGYYVITGSIDGNVILASLPCALAATTVLFGKHIDKLEAEVQLMQAQLALRATMKDREEAGKEVHELMVEKTKLEIDSLRLHIAELRKRMEDWNSD